MSVSAKLVKELREMTGAGMMDCKKALVEVDGDIDSAVEFLRKKGIGKAAKKADRSASEGLICMSENSLGATVVEINSETDFVAKNKDFQDLSSEIASHILESNTATVEDVMKSSINGENFKEFFDSKIAIIGENLVLRRFKTIKKEQSGVVANYTHMGKIGVLVSIKCDAVKAEVLADETALNIAMHVAAMNPQYLDESKIPEDVLSKEKEIAIELLKKEGKPEKMWDKILPGKIAKFKKENTLLGQQYIIDDKKTISNVLEDLSKEIGSDVKIVDFVRFELGEGLEKKSCDFAEEVASQLK
jgi:elongation factor Ts